MHFPRMNAKSILSSAAINRNAGDIKRSTHAKRRAMVLMVATLGILAASEVASATTYSFTIPTGLQGTPDRNTILGALNIAVQNGTPPIDPNLYGFYDFYIRPQLSGDGTLPSSPNPVNLITNYSMATSTVTAPVPGCVLPCVSAAYTATPNVAEPLLGGASAHFRFDAADNTIAIVSNNTSAGGHSYPAGANNPFPNLATTEIMPSAAAFSFTLTTSEYTAFQTPQITFEIYALAVQYTDSTAATLAVKDKVYFSNFDATGEAPEPSTMFIAGGGLCLMFLHRLRRKTKR
jgi:hypothetical protein